MHQNRGDEKSLDDPYGLVLIVGLPASFTGNFSAFNVTIDNCILPDAVGTMTPIVSADKR